MRCSSPGKTGRLRHTELSAMTRAIGDEVEMWEVITRERQEMMTFNLSWVYQGSSAYVRVCVCVCVCVLVPVLPKVSVYK